jgi:hypothetical protein
VTSGLPSAEPVGEGSGQLPLPNAAEKLRLESPNALLLGLFEQFCSLVKNLILACLLTNYN